MTKIDPRLHYQAYEEESDEESDAKELDSNDENDPQAELMRLITQKQALAAAMSDTTFSSVDLTEAELLADEMEMQLKEV